ncbi:MAG TPA: acyl-ACP--UDP-N-acetylglucosamine O-acyltransferase [Kiritimatiellia bacterium]|nr:acyl-ACP--UDP-N-acetylglucosamine O-acyltransferase [Kiritimatiellia bacterium]
MADIHPLAVVSPEARLGDRVVIGPFCCVGPDVTLGAGTRLISHVVVDGCTQVGSGCTFFPFASVGMQTQDLKFKGGRPGTIIGDNTTLRESVTVHAATADGDFTRVGSNCHIMAYSHIAHDCVVGDQVIIANAGTLAGHVIVEDRVLVGGLSGIHQFVRLGRQCIIGGCSKITQDVPPYMMVDGNPPRVPGVNLLGLKRAGLSEETQQALKQAHRLLYRSELGTRAALDRIEQEVKTSPELQHLLAFVRASERGIVK